MDKNNPKAGMSWLLDDDTSVFSYLVYSSIPPEERVSAVVSHITQQAKADRGDNAEPVDWLCESIGRAVESDDQAEAIYRAFSLGEISGKESENTARAIKKRLEQERKKFRQFLPIKTRQHANKLLRTLIQGFAAEAWKRDAGHLVRVGVMTKWIMEMLPSLNQGIMEILKDRLPTTDDALHSYLENRKLPVERTVHRWIADVAPAYARKSGQPPRN